MTTRVSSPPRCSPGADPFRTDGTRSLGAVAPMRVKRFELGVHHPGLVVERLALASGTATAISTVNGTAPRRLDTQLTSHLSAVEAALGGWLQRLRRLRRLLKGYGTSRPRADPRGGAGMSRRRQSSGLPRRSPAAGTWRTFGLPRRPHLVRHRRHLRRFCGPGAHRRVLCLLLGRSESKKTHAAFLVSYEARMVEDRWQWWAYGL